ncbi:hypothetical protein J6590_079908 [Homalodisca vitripennis]|nr:hypothetical protein J6590_079908 [Homalodisca vitripennis]
MSKKPSGCFHRKKAKARQQEAAKSSTLMSSWLQNIKGQDEAEPEATRNKPSVQEDAVGEENAGGEDLMDVCAEEEDNNDFICEKPHTSHATDFWASSTSFQEAVSVSDSKGPNHEEQESECEYNFNFNDPGTWPTQLSDKKRCYIIQRRCENDDHNPDLSKSVLKKIDRVSKFLQREDTTVDNAARNIQGLLNVLSSTRDLTVSEAIDEVTFLANNMGITAEYKETRKRKKKKMTGDTHEDDGPNFTEEEEELFKRSLFQICDRIIRSNKKMDVKTLKSKAKELATTYASDLNEEELFGIGGGRQKSSLPPLEEMIDPALTATASCAVSGGSCVATSRGSRRERACGEKFNSTWPSQCELARQALLILCMIIAQQETERHGSESGFPWNCDVRGRLSKRILVFPRVGCFRNVKVHSNPHLI